jgi:threonine/homoserine/homoserine lactone efflux protein
VQIQLRRYNRLTLKGLSRMEIFTPWLKGFIIGFSIAAPVGPIGMLCIQRTLAYGRLTGLLSGLGAASADLLYGLISGLGLTVISAFLISGQFWLQIGGIIFLTYLGIRAFLTVPAANEVEAQPISPWKAYITTFGLTLTNPITIISFTGIMAGAGITSGDLIWIIAFVFGVFCGSAGWWLLLTFGVSLLRTRLTPQSMRWINRFSGAVILVFVGFMLKNIITAL